MGTFTKGNIVLFPFPYTDLSTRKIRPCLVLSDEMGDDVILCQVTSQIRRDLYSIEVKHNETINGSLSIDSYIRANMIFTAAKAQIQGRLCSISPEKYAQIIHLIERIISASP